jgi:hypothetical protein
MRTQHAVVMRAICLALVAAGGGAIMPDSGSTSEVGGDR